MINRKKAFSLVELMVVIAIVALLAAVAVPVYKTYVTKAKIASLLELLDPIKKQVLEAHNKGTIYGQTNGPSLYPLGGANNPKYVRQVATGWYGCIEIDYDLPSLGIPYSGNDRVCLLQCPIDTNGVVTWVCQYHTGCNTQATVISYLPANCQQSGTTDGVFYQSTF